MYTLNLGLRFILEMAVLFVTATWGWSQYEGWLKYFLAIGLPLLFAVIWGVFAVPDDPSRSGKTVVVTPGWIRLIIEFTFFGFGVWAFFVMGYHVVSIFFIIVVTGHYFISFERVKWLIRQ